jgi:hypothetical protein
MHGIFICKMHLKYSPVWAVLPITGFEMEQTVMAALWSGTGSVQNGRDVLGMHHQQSYQKNPDMTSFWNGKDELSKPTISAAVIMIDTPTAPLTPSLNPGLEKNFIARHDIFHASMSCKHRCLIPNSSTLSHTFRNFRKEGAHGACR